MKSPIIGSDEEVVYSHGSSHSFFDVSARAEDRSDGS